MAKIKQVAKYENNSWGNVYDLGADAVNIDVSTGENTTTDLQSLMTNIQTNLSNVNTGLNNKVNIDGGNIYSTVVTGNISNASSETSSAITQSDIFAQSGDSTKDLWEKFNKFVRRVNNKFNNYVLKAGDTMTGNLGIKSSSLSSNMSAPSSQAGTTYGSGIRLTNSDNYLIGSFQPFVNPDNEHGTFISGRRQINNENVVNSLNLKVAADGTQVISVSSPYAWRQGLGLLSQYQSQLSDSTNAVSVTSTSSDNISAARGTRLTQLTLTPGFWLVKGTTFIGTNNTTGLRRLGIVASNDANTATLADIPRTQYIDATPGFSRRIEVITFLRINGYDETTQTTDTYVNLRALQTSGSTIDYNYSALQALRLFD